MKKIILAGLAVLAVAGLFAAHGVEARQPSPKGAEVYLIAPMDGDIVSNPVTVVFGLKGMGIAPAGTLKENTGHHHLLIDVKKLPPSDQPIPMDDTHKHFGGGQTETAVTLAPGEHTLQLLLGDLTHIPHNPPVVSRKITITVK